MLKDSQAFDNTSLLIQKVRREKNQQSSEFMARFHSGAVLAQKTGVLCSHSFPYSSNPTPTVSRCPKSELLQRIGAIKCITLFAAIK